jgi:hypothetical protein
MGTARRPKADQNCAGNDYTALWAAAGDGPVSLRTYKRRLRRVQAKEVQAFVAA